MAVKKVVTFKAGHFRFSDIYDAAALSEAVVEARVLTTTVAELPVLPSLAAKLDEEVIRRSIFSTAALEGNPLSEEEVGRVLEAADATEFKERAEIETANLKKAYRISRGLDYSGGEIQLSEGLVKQIHQTLTAGIESKVNRPGRYREGMVKVGYKDHGGIYTPPKILDDIKKLMSEFIAWINSDDLLGLPPPIRAALAHYHLGLIHPFGDGNGRTARLVEAIILQSQGLRWVPEMMSNYYYQKPDDYYWAFSLARKNRQHDVTPFVEFVLRAFVGSLYEIRDKVTFFIRLFAVRDYLAFIRKERNITQRQYDLLLALLENMVSFNIDDLFKRSPFDILYRQVSLRTAQRDLAKLTRMGLLTKDPQGAYSLNLGVLDGM